LLKQGANGGWLGVCQSLEITYYAKSCNDDRNRHQPDDKSSTDADNAAFTRRE
jgi:hypothetical protein